MWSGAAQARASGPRGPRCSADVADEPAQLGHLGVVRIMTCSVDILLTIPHRQPVGSATSSPSRLGEASAAAPTPSPRPRPTPRPRPRPCSTVTVRLERRRRLRCSRRRRRLSTIQQLYVATGGRPLVPHRAGITRPHSSLLLSTRRAGVLAAPGTPYGAVSHPTTRLGTAQGHSSMPREACCPLVYPHATANPSCSSTRCKYAPPSRCGSEARSILPQASLLVATNFRGGNRWV